jgi:ribulose-5-phosphate 4-epimerase/fuculose-1-phosphate aldolase
LNNLGNNQAMMLRNHGILTTGRTVPEAFIRLYRLERACQIQVDAGGAGTLNILGDNLAAKSGADMDAFSERESGGLGDLEFAALIRKLDKVDTSWRH